MRTTLNIEDETFVAARAYAERRGVSLSKAPTELVRRGLSVERPIEMRDGVPVLTPGPDTPPMTDEDVRKALNEWP